MNETTPVTDAPPPPPPPPPSADKNFAAAKDRAENNRQSGPAEGPENPAASRRVETRNADSNDAGRGPAGLEPRGLEKTPEFAKAEQRALSSSSDRATPSTPSTRSTELGPTLTSPTAPEGTVSGLRRVEDGTHAAQHGSSRVPTSREGETREAQPPVDHAAAGTSTLRRVDGGAEQLRQGATVLPADSAGAGIAGHGTPREDTTALRRTATPERPDVRSTDAPSAPAAAPDSTIVVDQRPVPRDVPAGSEGPELSGGEGVRDAAPESGEISEPTDSMIAYRVVNASEREQAAELAAVDREIAAGGVDPSDRESRYQERLDALFEDKARGSSSGDTWLSPTKVDDLDQVTLDMAVAPRWPDAPVGSGEGLEGRSEQLGNRLYRQYEVEVPPGTGYLDGIAGPQGLQHRAGPDATTTEPKIHSELLGGGEQIYVPAGQGQETFVVRRVPEDVDGTGWRDYTSRADQGYRATPDDSGADLVPLAESPTSTVLASDDEVRAVAKNFRSGHMTEHRVGGMDRGAPVSEPGGAAEDPGTVEPVTTGTDRNRERLVEVLREAAPEGVSLAMEQVGVHIDPTLVKQAILMAPGLRAQIGNWWHEHSR